MTFWQATEETRRRGEWMIVVYFGGPEIVVDYTLTDKLGIFGASFDLRGPTPVPIPSALPLYTAAFLLIGVFANQRKSAVTPLSSFRTI